MSDCTPSLSKRASRALRRWREQHGIGIASRQETFQKSGRKSRPLDFAAFQPATVRALFSGRLMRPRERTQVSNKRHREPRTPLRRSHGVHESQGCFARAREQPPWPRRSFSLRSSHRLPRVQEVQRSVSGTMAPEDGHSCPSGFGTAERMGTLA